jgi:D-sedoheptulose 7-phosphate isomerase
MKFTIENYIKQHNLTIENLDYQEIENAINLIKETAERGKRIAVCGNGGSAVAASHYITDWNKMVYSHTSLKFNGICLSDNVGLITAYSNDLSYNEVFSEQVKNLLEEGDLLITLSGSGNSENVIKATEVANGMKINTLAICGYDGGKLKQVSSSSVWIRSNDMQLCEDAQTVFGHMAMKSLCKEKIFVDSQSA